MPGRSPSSRLMATDSAWSRAPISAGTILFFIHSFSKRKKLSWGGRNSSLYDGIVGIAEGPSSALAIPQGTVTSGGSTRSRSSNSSRTLLGNIAAATITSPATNPALPPAVPAAAALGVGESVDKKKRGRAISFVPRPVASLLSPQQSRQESQKESRNASVYNSPDTSTASSPITSANPSFSSLPAVAQPTHMQSPKVINLKGMFSVATTSTKAPYLIRDEVVRVLGVSFYFFFVCFFCLLNSLFRTTSSISATTVTSFRVCTSRPSSRDHCALCMVPTRLPFLRSSLRFRLSR